VDWSKDRYEEIKQQMTQFLTNAGFLPKNISFVPCSGLEGINVVKKPENGVIPWYTGRTLLGELGLLPNFA
jgi:elongation factor 1 alpha-like protein